MEDEKVFYFPPRKSEIGDYMDNLQKHLFPVYATYGMTKPEMDSLTADTLWMMYVSGRANVLSKSASDFISTRDTSWTGDPANKNLELTSAEAQPVPVETPPPGVRPDVEARVRSLVRRLLKHPAMTPTFAKNAGLLSWPVPEPKPVEQYKPTLTGKVISGVAELNCPLKGFKGYEVWVSDNETGNYALLKLSLERFFEDPRPLAEGVNAEVRYYKVRMLSGNVPIGEYSAALKLTVTRAI